IFLDPLFVDLPGNIYRTLAESPVIDAGNPTDPAPPGTGNRVDIGYVEEGRAAFYAAADYCEFCPNDGLTWGVDAFDTVADALAAAAAELASLNFPDQPPQYTVGVGPGLYAENLTVPSYVRLIGSGAEETILNAAGNPNAVTFDGVVQAEISGFTIAGASSAGVAVSGAANAITIAHNIIKDNSSGVVFDG
ncbi:MAG: hypothetical protein GTO03_16695, partial [Planctomycetales bacterium]|nr:hypothetical protein [Planctomycetales bacterium]